MTSPDAPAPGEDPVAQAILDLLAARGAGKSISPEAAARAFAAARAKNNDPPDLWRRYMNAVRQQALHLARQGRMHSNWSMRWRWITRVRHKRSAALSELSVEAVLQAIPEVTACPAPAQVNRMRRG